MNNVSHTFLADDTVLDNELDELFGQLEHIDPPVDMVKRIMNAVLDLPRYKPASAWDNLVELTVAYDLTQLS